jgi:hypothetical protein
VKNINFNVEARALRHSRMLPQLLLAIEVHLKIKIFYKSIPLATKWTLNT